MKNPVRVAVVSRTYKPSCVDDGSNALNGAGSPTLAPVRSVSGARATPGAPTSGHGPVPGNGESVAASRERGGAEVSGRRA